MQVIGILRCNLKCPEICNSVRDDCMKLLTECSEHLGPGQVGPLCDELSSSSNDSCLALSTFIDEHDPGMLLYISNLV